MGKRSPQSDHDQLDGDGETAVLGQLGLEEFVIQDEYDDTDEGDDEGRPVDLVNSLNQFL